ncbi:MAG: CotH kinase family protein [Vicinamibacterales bacterium]
MAPAHAQTVDDLFQSQDLQRLELWLNKADWSKLLADFQVNTYYPADITWNGQTARNVGIRSRGRGSRSGNKPGLRVDFDRYASGQTFLGAKSFVLDNLTQDPSGIHEAVAMAFNARLGIPAPREIHTRLYVNGAYAGLYTIIEAVDKDLLARVFGSIGDDVQNDGYLYEFKYQDDWRFNYLGSGLDEYKIRFEATTHESKSDEDLYRPIETLVRLVNDTPADRLTATIGNIFDIPAFIRYLAAQTFMADTDGFLGNAGMNNFYLYRLEKSDLQTLIAWDADNAFWGPEFSIDTTWARNTLVDKLMSIPEYNALFITEMKRTVEMAEADGWLNTEIIRDVQRIDTAMKEDPVKPHTEASYLGSVGAMLDFAGHRITFVKCELERGAGKCFQ